VIIRAHGNWDYFSFEKVRRL